MRKILIGAVGVAWLGLVGLLTFVLPASNRYSGRVVAISEGARIVILRDGVPRSLRLAEVSFPEKGHPRAREASAFASKLARGLVVAVEEARLADGSRMAYVTLPDGRSLSAELVREGLAWPSKKHAGRLATSLAALQTRAMSDRRGLWAEMTVTSVSRRARAARVSGSADGELSEPDAGPADADGATAADSSSAADAGSALGEN